MDAALLALSERYRHSGADASAVGGLYDRYARQRERSILDAASAAAAVHASFISDRIADPQMREAFALAYKNVDSSTLGSLSPEAVEGFVRAWKGKYFEVLIRDRLNRGEWVGDIRLAAGERAELAEDVTQPGWDLRLLAADGTAIEELQLKATESLGYVRRALETYPDIRVIATDDVALLSEDAILPSGLLEAGLEERIRGAMEQLVDSPLTDLAEDMFGVLPFVLIVGEAGFCVMTGRMALRQAIVRSGERTVKTGLSIGVGALVALLDGGIIALPATMLTRVTVDRVQTNRRMVRRLERETAVTRRLHAAAIA